MQNNSKTITNYIESLPLDRREIIKQVHKKICFVTPELKVKLWQQKLWGGYDVTIIGYGEYTHTYSSGREVHWFLIGLASQKNYISLYINAVEKGKYLPEIYKNKLGKVKIGKSCINFKTLADINLDTVVEMVKHATVISGK